MTSEPSLNHDYLAFRAEGRAKHTLGEADFLYRLTLEMLRRAPGAIAVEIGTWRGMATAVMALAGAFVITCDPYERAQGVDREVPMGTLAEAFDTWERLGVTARIEAHVCTSLELAHSWDHGRCIGLLFVDGSHTAENVAADIKAWQPYMLPQGVMAFHDWGYAGQPRYARNRGVRKGITLGGLHGLRSYRIDKLKAIYLD